MDKGFEIYLRDLSEDVQREMLKFLGYRGAEDGNLDTIPLAIIPPVERGVDDVLEDLKDIWRIAEFQHNQIESFRDAEDSERHLKILQEAIESIRQNCDAIEDTLSKILF
jgi:hypothetical protein